MPQIKGYIVTFLLEYLAQAQENLPALGRQWWTSPDEVEKGKEKLLTDKIKNSNRKS